MREEIYGFIKEQENSYPFFIEMAGISYCDGTYKIIRESSDVYVFEYIIEGEGIVTVDSNKFIAKSGDMYILDKNKYHYYYSDSKRPWIKVWFNATGSLIDNILNVYNMDEINHIKGIDIKNLFYEMFDTCKKSNGIFEDVAEICSIILHKIIIKVYSYLRSNTIEGLNYTAEKMKVYLDSHFKENISLEQLSKEVYLSKSQAIRVFKNSYNITPYNYLMNRKIEFAKLMLLNSKTSIKEISLTLGFTDQQYFSNYFREKVGVSPSKFRITKFQKINRI